VSAPPDVLNVDIPVRTVSNAREHHFAHARRVKLERTATFYAWREAGGRPLQPGETARITLTRVGVGQLDEHENLPHSFKGCVDEIAACLGLPKQDNSPRLSWAYEQRRGGPREYRVLVRVEFFRQEAL
jgi:hypothetical protein